MQRGVRTIQATSQKKLKGRPNTVGLMRSQRDTEKQTAMNGIKPRRIAPNDGRFTVVPVSDAGNCIRDLCQRLMEIGDDVVHVFDPDGDSHHTIGDSDGRSSLLTQGSVGHRRGMGDEGLHTA